MSRRKSPRVIAAVRSGRYLRGCTVRALTLSDFALHRRLGLVLWVEFLVGPLA